MNESIPFVDLRPVVNRVTGEPEFHHDLLNTLYTCQFINAPAVETFEHALAKYLNVEHVVACANGTDALVLALKARGIGPGDRVAIPNLTFWATYEAVAAVGAEPVLIDADIDHLQMDIDACEDAYNRESFDAAILVHLFGWASPSTERFRRLCKSWRIPLIEDAAQAIGVRLNKRPLLEDADLATLSFHPAKVLGGIMDGGAVVCASQEDADSLRALRNHGRGDEHYVHIDAGMNSRMSAINAAYLTRQLALLDNTIEARNEIIRAYAVDYDINIYEPPAGVEGNGYLLVTKAIDPVARVEKLRAARIEAARIYPRTIADQPCFPSFDDEYMPVSREFCRRVINLPVWYGMSPEQVKRAAEAFREAVG